MRVGRNWDNYDPNRQERYNKAREGGLTHEAAEAVADRDWDALAELSSFDDPDPNRQGWERGDGIDNREDHRQERLCQCGASMRPTLKGEAGYPEAWICPLRPDHVGHDTWMPDPNRQEHDFDPMRPIPGPDPGQCPRCGCWRRAGMRHVCNPDDGVPWPGDDNPNRQERWLYVGNGRIASFRQSDQLPEEGKALMRVTDHEAEVAELKQRIAEQEQELENYG